MSIKLFSQWDISNSVSLDTGNSNSFDLSTVPPLLSRASFTRGTGFSLVLMILLGLFVSVARRVCTVSQGATFLVFILESSNPVAHYIDCLRRFICWLLRYINGYLDMLVCLYPQNRFMYSSVSQPLITTYQGIFHNMLTVSLYCYIVLQF